MDKNVFLNSLEVRVWSLEFGSTKKYFVFQVIEMNSISNALFNFPFLFLIGQKMFIIKT